MANFQNNKQIERKSFKGIVTRSSPRKIVKGEAVKRPDGSTFRTNDRYELGLQINEATYKALVNMKANPKMRDTEDGKKYYIDLTRNVRKADGSEARPMLVVLKEDGSEIDTLPVGSEVSVEFNMGNTQSSKGTFKVQVLKVVVDVLAEGRDGGAVSVADDIAGDDSGEIEVDVPQAAMPSKATKKAPAKVDPLEDDLPF